MAIPTRWVIAGPRLTASSGSLQVLQRAQAGNKLDVGDMQRLQTDVLSLPAQQLIGLLRAATAQREPSPGAELLLHWNGEVERDSAAAALYEVWLQIVTRETMNLAIPASAQDDD